jgi:hypothetical protein
VQSVADESDSESLVNPEVGKLLKRALQILGN